MDREGGEGGVEVGGWGGEGWVDREGRGGWIGRVARGGWIGRVGRGWVDREGGEGMGR